MAYNFVAASSQYLNVGSAPLTVTPITISANFYATNTSIQVIVGLGSTSSANQFQVGKSTNTGAGVQASGTVGSSATSNISLNVFNQVVGVFTSSTSRLGYLNGVAGTQNTADLTPANIDELGIGARINGAAWGLFYDAQIAEAAIWNVALTDAEITSLAKGFKPTRIRPQSLVFYAPLIRNLQDTKGGLAITNNNSATVAEHPRVY